MVRCGDSRLDDAAPDTTIRREQAEDMSSIGQTRDLSLTRALVRSAHGVDPSTLSSAVIDKLKICLLDFLSCAFEARNLPWSRQAIVVTPRAERGASVVGTGVVAAPADAAFANAVLGHGLVREDMHAASISHHGVVVWPVLLALGQRAPVDGARLLCAAAVGYETGARIGRALFTADLARLFRPTGILGPVGGAMAGGYLLALNEDAAVSAVAIAANTSSGLNEWPHTGGSEMYFHPGFAARNAIAAVELAEAGAFASESILEGEAGMFAAFKRERLTAPIELFADGAEILSVYNKPVPACNFAQTACQAALQVAREIEDVGDVANVSVHLPEAAIRYPGCDFQGPFDRALQAKMSIPYGVAAALARKTVDEENYNRLDDPVILRLASTVTLQRDARFTASFPAAQGAEVEVDLVNGARISRRIDDVIPATEAEIRDRFHEAAASLVGAQRANQIEDLVDRFESIDDAGGLPSLCAPHEGVMSARDPHRQQLASIGG